MMDDWTHDELIELCERQAQTHALQGREDVNQAVSWFRSIVRRGLECHQPPVGHDERSTGRDDR